MAVKSQTMCFVVAGADFTRMVRERLLDDNPGHAWRIASCLGGDASADTVALHILKGETRLVGDSTVGMKARKESPAVKAAHEAAIRYLYAGRIKVDDAVWYRPVAKVIDYGINDLKNDHGKAVYRVGSGLKVGFANRGWHYAGPREIVIDDASEVVDVIFEPCGELPHWMVPARNAAAAVAEWTAAGRTLDERGHSLRYGTEEPTLTDAEAEAILEQVAATEIDDETTEESTAEKWARIDAENAEHDRKEAARRAGWRAEILARAGDDLLTLTWDAADGKPAGTATVPRAPFIRWAISAYPRLRYLMPPWENVCPSGLKLPMDNQDHTDWMIGGGLDLKDSYNTLVAAAAMSASSEIISELSDRANDGVVTLVSGPTVTSRVVHGERNKPAAWGSVVVVPDLRPAYLLAIERAAAVITEAGGVGAHLAQIGRERALPMIVVPNALQRFKAGDRVTVDTEDGQVRYARGPQFDEDEDDDEP